VSVFRVFRVLHEGAPRYALEREGSYRLIEGDVFAGPPFTTGATVEPARILAPAEPSKIVAIGLNYKDHAIEQKKALPAEPLMFMKPPTAVIGPDEVIRLPANAGRIEYEAELAIVMGKRAYHVPADRALEYVLGYTCMNDVTARELQAKDVQYTRAKGFDTFAPIGPCIAVGLDPSSLDIQAWINGERRQSSNTRQLIFGVSHLIAHVTSVMTLLPGDIISTGTPAGVGALGAGDRIRISVAGIGDLNNTVA
jgi:2-keto-4-pentenoate hydratase/2-oxohepta-3-ene-1,7-dioic acid hydratase in catechol pathway